MIAFVNAKINIGLRILRKRSDGYHDLETLFYPVGLYGGTAENPTSFCDILEIMPDDTPGVKFQFTGRKVDCPLEKNLVYKAVNIYKEERGLPCEGLDVRLHKTLPDGAGMGGGSADAAFTLRLLAALDSNPPTQEELASMALKLGADCPFFIYNTPMIGEGVGERLTPVDFSLSGYWLVVVKPDCYISTKEAFAGVTRDDTRGSLVKDIGKPLNSWENVTNDFEGSIFTNHPELMILKKEMISHGAEYASMTGSGSCIYGIFRDLGKAKECERSLAGIPTLEGVYLLKL